MSAKNVLHYRAFFQKMTVTPLSRKSAVRKGGRLGKADVSEWDVPRKGGFLGIGDVSENVFSR